MPGLEELRDKLRDGSLEKEPEEAPKPVRSHDSSGNPKFNFPGFKHEPLDTDYPTSAPPVTGVLYCEDGALKWRSDSGKHQVIAGPGEPLEGNFTGHWFNTKKLGVRLWFTRKTPTGPEEISAFIPVGEFSDIPSFHKRVQKEFGRNKHWKRHDIRNIYKMLEMSIDSARKKLKADADS